MKIDQIHDTDGNLIHGQQHLPGKMTDNTDNMPWILRFVSSHVYRMENIRDVARQKDLQNYIDAQLRLRSVYYRQQVDLELERSQRANNDKKSEIRKGANNDLNGHLLDAANKYEDQCKKVNAQESLSEVIKEKLLQKALDHFIFLVADLEAMYRNNDHNI